MIKDYYVYRFIQIMEVTKMERLEYCYECNKDVNPTIKTEKNKYTYRGKEFLVVEEVHYCPKCGNILINDNFDNDMYKIYDCYLKLFNLSFEKIKEIRIKLNLSQEVFSKILGWSKKSIIKYFLYYHLVKSIKQLIRYFIY